MPSSRHPCGPSFTSDFHLLAHLSCPPSPSTLQPELVLSKMEICLRHPPLNPRQWLPTVLRCSPDALTCLFASPSPSGPTDLPLTLWAAGTGASPGPMGSILSLRGLCCTDFSARNSLLPWLVDSTSIGLSFSVSLLANLP